MLKSYAILPPLYHGLNELKAIINDPRLYQNLQSSEIIEKIEKVNDGYIIYTQERKVKVDINYLPIQRPGPGQFELTFQIPQCR
jgi:hypothetical protein